MRPQVSVVIPFRNAESTLRSAVDSVLSQTFSRWELLLVDDGSSDSGPALARGLHRERPGRIRILAHPGGAHRGTFASRLLGARRGRAPVLAFLDADDAWDSRYLEYQLRFWRRHARAGVAMTYGPARHWVPGVPSGKKDFVQTMPALGERVFPPGELLQNFLSGAFAGAPKPSCCLVRREAFLKLGRFARAARRSPSVEDWFLAWGVGARWAIAVHNRPLVRYRRRWAVDAIPPDVVKKSLSDERRALEVIRDDLARHRPEHPLLAADGIPARLKALRGFKRPPPFGDFFLRKIPNDLRRMARAG